jgi:hypothetical protein
LDFPSGFTGFTTPATFVQFAYAIKARASLYAGNLAEAATAIALSFANEAAPLSLGVYYNFGTGSNEIPNELFDPTDSIILAHPTMWTDALPTDPRATDKLSLVAAVSDPFGYGISSNRVFNIHMSAADSVPIIRNVELLLIRAEVSLATGDRATALTLVNSIRDTFGLSSILDPGDPGLLNEILYNRRYSLMLEGHRWIDLRRHNRLATLPLDLPTFRVDSLFPFPARECSWWTPSAANPGC